MRQYIGGFDSFIQEKDLHDLMRELAKYQSLTEHMVMKARGIHWDLAISLLRRELREDHRSAVRRMVDFVINGLPRDVPRSKDVGSTLVEDLAVPNVGTRDVVVSWANSEKDLVQEVTSIRTCLDTLGIFDEQEQKKLQEVHAKVGIQQVGEISVQMDREHHTLSTSGNLKLGPLLTLMGQMIPGLQNLRLGATVSHPIPFNDSRDKFIAAVLALEIQSKGVLPSCTNLKNYREKWSDPQDLTVDELKNQWIKSERAKTYLEKTMAAVDQKMRLAYTAHEEGRFEQDTYNICLRALRNRRYQYAIKYMEEVKSTLIPIKSAMGENYYLFAANVIMQAQIGMFQEDLQCVLKDRFGIDPQDLPSGPAGSDSAPLPPGTSDTSSSTPTDSTLGQCRPGRRRP